MKCCQSSVVGMRETGIGELIEDVGVRGGGKGFVLRVRLVLLATLSWLTSNGAVILFSTKHLTPQYRNAPKTEYIVRDTIYLSMYNR